MRTLPAILLCIAGLPAAQAAPGDWNFRVLLNGREVGRHQFTLTGSGTQRELRSAAEFDVRLLFITAFRYQHEAIERWQGDCLESLEARTETNGQRQQVRAAAHDGRLEVLRPQGRDQHAGCVMSFAYWNPRILEARQLLNSQSGELIPVTITAQGAETISVRGESRTATRHRIDGDGVQIDLWYADGQWLGLEALAPGGRRLRYELI